MKTHTITQGNASEIGLRDTLLNAWHTSNRVTIYLVEHLSDEFWEARLPAAPRRTIRMLAAHLHNARCMWIKTLGNEHGFDVPQSVDRYEVTQQELVTALQISGKGILDLLIFGCDHGGTIPESRSYVWRNLPLDVGHVLSYFVAHEGHHRGQIVMLARELGHRLPEEVTSGIWQWTKRARE